ncbi:MAG: ABC transporter ATP-binding protein [Candidatus Eisenbacteria bacterium]|uniref:ABC transporter ATP-binding protein n=1 Tax=Eiseniibacteriota bacterium TaxID=2212470 RepID=A0A956NCN3_UNCEI|nr:ABC transporter ATP-binding protein [Candidatus Eisenbacteria bacterium]MCB9463892.1 ABC transporter ATP-binding protein [Candidatus Eisenbacteria bacterium]
MLSVRNLVKIYPGPVPALRGVDLEVPTGMFGLLGPNGAGKSTLMKVIAGLLEPTSGEVRLDGEDVLSDPDALHRRLGYLPQDFGFYPNLSGRDMLAYLLELKGVDAPGGRKKLVEELLERVNLTFAAKRKVKGYSGGMKQRLGIAQAIAGNPRLIIVDEPTAGLDPEERHRFYRILAELATERTVLLSTHIVEDVAVLCPRFVVISQGRIVAGTTPTEAKDKLRGRIFEGSAGGDLDEMRSRFWVTQAVLVEGRNLVRIFAPDGRAPEGFAEVEPTLEDAYMTLVGNGRPAGLAVSGAEVGVDSRVELVGTDPSEGRES